MDDILFSTAEITEQDKREIDSSIHKQKFVSMLDCFKVHNGIRPSEFSVIVGKSGQGKSSLCKTIISEVAVNGYNSLVFLSEEKTSVYKQSMHKGLTMASKDASAFLKRINITSMLDWKPEQKTEKKFFYYLEKYINEFESELVVFDNFTTSFMGSLPISKQGEIIDKFRLLASAYDIAIISAFHTQKGSDQYKRVLDGEDVRGNATATNAGSYNYILSTYFRLEKPKAILTIDKARYHPRANKTYWELEYNVETGMYYRAREVNYDYVAGLLDDVREQQEEYKKKKKLKREYKW